MSPLDAPLDSVDAYVALFTRQEIPVLRHTVRTLEALRDREESVNGRHIAAIVQGDPLMTMRLLVHLQAHRPAAQNHDITTIDRAVMMMGVPPFLATFSNLPTLEDQLAGNPRALLGALQVIGRARKAAHFARDWAIVRHDLDVDEITVAALLREATEIMMWIFAPALSLKVQAMQKADPNLRAVAAQRAVFGVAESEVQLALVRAWNMPELLVTLLDEAHWENPRVRNVRLASDLARHVAHGWDNPAVPDDLAEIERLLHVGREPLLRRLGVPFELTNRFLGDPAAPEPASTGPAPGDNPR